MSPTPSRRKSDSARSKRHVTVPAFFPVAVVLAVVAAIILAGRLRPAFRSWAEQRVKLIDDFNDSQEANLIGGNPFTLAFQGAQVSQALIRIKTPAQGDLACAVTYDLPPGSHGGWGTSLNELDISAARMIRLWLKADRVPLPDLQLEIADDFGATQQVKMSVRATTRWQQVSLPTASFGTINFNQLKRLTVHVRPAEGAREGTLYLDDITFIGPSPLFFRSLEDNLFGFPKKVLTNAKPLLNRSDEQLLRAIAQDTWGYFRDITDSRHHLPLNYVQTGPTKTIGDYTSTTDIAMYLMAVVSAYDLDLIDYQTALQRVTGTLEQLDQLPKWKHLFFNYYSTTNLQVTRQYISSVDNGWLAAAFVVVRQAFPEARPLATKMFDAMDFKEFYDPQNGQMRLGYEVEEERFAPYHYGLLATEARIISAVAIGKGDVEESHWYRVYRTLPKEWTWQQQSPKGRYRTYRGHDVFQGYYTYDEMGEPIPIVPGWGGSLFEFLMPTLVLDEQRLAPEGFGLNNQRVVDIHRHYATKIRHYPVWGLSPSATPHERHGGYSEFGVAALGSKGYKDEAIVTPHVTALSLAIRPKEAIANLRQLIRRYNIYGPYGFYDAVDVKTGEVVHRYLALDQGMFFIALNNYLSDNAIVRRFSQDPIMKRIEPLLREEKFFE